MQDVSDIRVSFVVAGTQKGGTTALDAYLREHPGIGMASKKELHYFDRERNFPAGREPDHERYHAHFAPADARAGLVLGESTPSYMYWRPTARRIFEYNPRMKLIISLRDPIKRAFSHWNMERQRGRELRPFGQAIREEDHLEVEGQHRVHSYIARGLYADQLERLWHYFPREQTLVLENTAIRSDPQAALDRITDLLGVERLPLHESKDVHTRQYESAMEESDRMYLRQIFEPEVERLAAMLGTDLSHWMREPATVSR